MKFFKSLVDKIASKYGYVPMEIPEKIRQVNYYTEVVELRKVLVTQEISSSHSDTMVQIFKEDLVRQLVKGLDEYLIWKIDPGPMDTQYTVILYLGKLKG